MQDYELFYIGFEGTLTLKNLTIRHAQSFDIYGGAIYNDTGILKISNCTITDNKCKKGGAIGNFNYATLSIKDSTISSNTVYDANLQMAGAIYNSVNSIATIQSSTFSGNSAKLGGAIYNAGTLEITNSTFSGNIALQDGGAIYNIKEISIINSTLFGNSAFYQGAGIYNAYASLNFRNTIIANSTKGDDCHNGNLGTIGINQNNLVEDGGCSAAYSGDPLLGSLADNGGPTKTHALLTGSNAIDTGYMGACPTIDQRGIDRPQGGGCDIGAFEKEYPLVFLPLITK